MPAPHPFENKKLFPIGKGMPLPYNDSAEASGCRHDTCPITVLGKEMLTYVGQWDKISIKYRDF